MTEWARFDYGWIVQQTQRRVATVLARPLLWMLALDRAECGEDPSRSPWLPLQAASTHNPAVLWTRDIACVEDGPCTSGCRWVQGACVPRLG
ncbi:MAG: hypothetical protein RMK29_06765 [Myxococcales bacterium]|nr:hypothetical protein [Myxococcales bacterium]